MFVFVEIKTEMCVIGRSEVVLMVTGLASLVLAGGVEGNNSSLVIR